MMQLFPGIGQQRAQGEILEKGNRWALYSPPLAGHNFQTAAWKVEPE